MTEATNHLNEVKQIVRDVDPRIDGTVVGSALRQVRDMLDPNRTDSLQKTLDQSIREVTTADGMLARQVKSTVEQALNPLKERVDELAKARSLVDHGAPLFSRWRAAYSYSPGGLILGGVGQCELSQ